MNTFARARFEGFAGTNPSLCQSATFVEKVIMLNLSSGLRLSIILSIAILTCNVHGLHVYTKVTYFQELPVYENEIYSLEHKLKF